MLERVAVGQHEPADALWVMGDDELAQRAARVVADERHIVELEPLEQLGDQTREPGRGEIGAAGIGIRCEPSGSSGTMHARSVDSSGTSGSQTRPLTSSPWIRTITGPEPSSR